MTIMRSIRNYLAGPTASGEHVDRAVSKVDEAIRVADELTDEARVVNTRLESYLDKNNPFMALLIDMSNAKAEKAMLSRLNYD